MVDCAKGKLKSEAELQAALAEDCAIIGDLKNERARLNAERHALYLESISPSDRAVGGVSDVIDEIEQSSRQILRELKAREKARKHEELARHAKEQEGKRLEHVSELQRMLAVSAPLLAGNPTELSQALAGAFGRILRHTQFSERATEKIGLKVGKRSMRMIVDEDTGYYLGINPRKGTEAGKEVSALTSGLGEGVIRNFIGFKVDIYTTNFSPQPFVLTKQGQMTSRMFLPEDQIGGRLNQSLTAVTDLLKQGGIVFQARTY